MMRPLLTPKQLEMLALAKVAGPVDLYDRHRRRTANILANGALYGYLTFPGPRFVINEAGRARVCVEPRTAPNGSLGDDGPKRYLRARGYELEDVRASGEVLQITPTQEARLALLGMKPGESAWIAGRWVDRDDGGWTIGFSPPFTRAKDIDDALLALPEPPPLRRRLARRPSR
jgi:hypothetical protein